MDENKVIRPMDFVRLTNIDESNVIKDTKKPYRAGQGGQSGRENEYNMDR